MVGRAAPFVGRGRELEILVAQLEGLRIGTGSATVVQGPAGIGKTSVVARAVDLGPSDLDVCRAACGAVEADVPFSTIADAFGIRASAEDQRAAELAELIGRPDGFDARFRIADGIVDLVEHRVLQRPVVLVLDDVHRADPATLLVLKRLVRLTAGLPFALLATRRPHPAPAAVVDALEGLAELALEPLDDDDLARLVDELLGSPPAPSLVTALRACGGNPFYAVELLRSLDADGRIERVDGHAQLVDGSLPSSLRAAVLHQLGHVGQPAVQVLRAAACLGPRFEVADLGVVLDQPATTLLDALGPALSSGLVVDDGPRLAFRHDVVRDAVYEDVPESARVALHGDIARRLRAAGRPAAEVAPHLLRGAREGDLDAVAMLRDAARESVLPTVAAELLTTALALAPVELADRDVLALDLADAHVAAGDLDRAEALARDMTRRAAPSGETDRAFGLLVMIHLSRHRLQEVLDVIEQWEPGEHGDPRPRALALAQAAFALTFANDFARGHELGDEALRLLGDRHDPTVEFYAGWAHAVTAFVDGGADVALTTLSRLEAFTQEADVDPRTRAELAWVLLFTLGGDEGLRPLVQQRCEAELQEAERAGRLVVVPMLLQAVVHNHLFWSELPEAIAAAHAAIAAAEEIGSRRFLSAVHAALARAHYHLGDLGEAERWLELAHRQVEDEGGRTATTEILVVGVEVFLTVARGRIDEAIDRLRAAHDQALMSYGIMTTHATLVPLHCRLLVERGRLDEAREVAAQLAEIAASAQHDANLERYVLQARGILELDGDQVLAGIAQHRAGLKNGFDPFPMALEDAGWVLTRAGRTDEAIAHLEEAREVWAGAGAQHDVDRCTALLRDLGVRRGVTGARGRPASGWDALTEAELRVADLVADGLTYREVGERLFISRRTVESHVARMFTKLDVASRRDLAAEVLRRRQ